uniref:C2H2-type domain-containing protein n=1 Tax=Anopheles maculatus TaxID=74869 RepID=A0A182SPI4_9DIPT
MLGKYGEASSGSMKNLDNGLRDRVLYHQNMLSMNLTAEFYHNPFLAASAGSNSGTTTASSTPTMAQSQKMLNSLATSPQQQQQQHTTSNGSATATTGPNSASSQQSLTQYQCQLCQKCFISSAVLAQHMKTHDTNGFLAREAVSYVQQQPQV